MSGDIQLPMHPKMHARLPIYYAIERKALTEWESQFVHKTAKYFNTKLAPLLGLPALFQHDELAPVLTITRHPYPTNQAKWATALYPQSDTWPIERIRSCTIELHPRWFESLWPARKQNLLRHEFAHLLGFGHTDDWRSVMHPLYCTGWWPWRLGLNAAERAELVRYWK